MKTLSLIMSHSCAKIVFNWMTKQPWEKWKIGSKKISCIKCKENKANRKSESVIFFVYIVTYFLSGFAAVLFNKMVAWITQRICSIDYLCTVDIIT